MRFRFRSRFPRFYWKCNIGKYIIIIFCTKIRKKLNIASIHILVYKMKKSCKKRRICTLTAEYKLIQNANRNPGAYCKTNTRTVLCGCCFNTDKGSGY